MEKITFIIIILTAMITIGLIIWCFYYGFHNMSKTRNEVMKYIKEKEEEEKIQKEKLVALFNKLYIGQTLYDIQGLLGSAGELKEERLLREEKLVYDNDVVKKVYVWKINSGYIRCTFYDDKLSAKEQNNLY